MEWINDDFLEDIESEYETELNSRDCSYWYVVGDNLGEGYEVVYLG